MRSRYFLTHGNIRKIHKARKFQDNNLRSSCEGRHLYNKMCGVSCSAVQCPPGQQSSGDPALAMVSSSLCIRIQLNSHTTPRPLIGMGIYQKSQMKVSDYRFINSFSMYLTVYRRGQRKTSYFGKYYSK